MPGGRLGAGMIAGLQRTDYDAADVRSLARTASDPDQVRRLLAIAAVYDGMNRAEAATVGGMDRQSLRDWVHRFNADGLEGLHDRKPSGTPKAPADRRTVRRKDMRERLQRGNRLAGLQAPGLSDVAYPNFHLPVSPKQTGRSIHLYTASARRNARRRDVIGP